jgi:ring-1,2-phenylacetyl-CoA epoxidase subunit PaaD
MTTSDAITTILDSIKDPELPAVSIVELGMVRGVQCTDKGVNVQITPTYSACPAIAMIEEEIKRTLRTHGYTDVVVTQVYAPPWTSDWITDEGRRKLKEYGIAPPQHLGSENVSFVPFPKRRTVSCPLCNSSNTTRTSEFGSTGCKALHYCNACKQPFEYFKEI